MKNVILSAKGFGFFLLSLVVIASFQNCSPVSFVVDAQDLGSQSKNCITDPSLCPLDPSGGPTCTFNGQNYTEGQTVTGFLYSSVPNGQSCVSEVRTCKEGSFTGSYPYASCGVAVAASCLFNGQTVTHGQAISAYQNSSVAFGSSCIKEDRICNNGVLNGTYNYASCSAGAAASCLFNGATIAHGAVVKAFQGSTVVYGQGCVSEDRTCSNGVLSGSYNYASCAVGSVASCLFNGQSIAHGGTVVGYASSTVAYGQTCSSAQRLCSNGSLSNSNYSFATCSPGAAASCSFNGQAIAHGQSVVGYAASAVNFGSACSAQTRTCNNGALSGSYSYSSCTTNAAQCPSGKVFNGSLNRCVSSLYGQYCTYYAAPTAVDQPMASRHCQLDGQGVWVGQNYCEYNSRGCGLGTCQCYTDGTYDTEGVCHMASQRQNAFVNAGYITYFGYIHLNPDYGWTPRPTTNSCR